MHLHDIAAQLINDTHASLWPAFAPEIVLCLTIMVMLIVRVLPGGRLAPGFAMAIAGGGVALYYARPWVYLAGTETFERQELFTGMLVLDGFTVFIRAFLLVFLVLFAVMTRLTKNPDKQDSIDFYCLVIGSIVGMCLMASANHLLIIFMAVEMASVPSYVLAGQIKNSSKGGEAALKYAIFGAGAAGVMLYGISLLAGILNTAHLPTMALQLYQLMPVLPAEQKLVLALGGLMVMVGLAFKLSAVPFHFWCPDVFEGASAEINAFLSIASKAGALALLVRVAIGFGIAPGQVTASAIAEVGTPAAMVAIGGEVLGESESERVSHAPATATAKPTTTTTKLVAIGETTAHLDSSVSPYGTGPLAPVRGFMVLVIGTMAMVTCTFGNLAAYAQTNIKRLMAYSTIAHAGYMMMAVPPAIAVSSTHPEIARSAVSALALYTAIYLLMNLAAFTIIAIFRNWLGSEEILAYSGLAKRSPLLVIMFALTLFSLVGIPPLAGFLGKFAIFAAVAHAWTATGNGFLLTILVVGGMNTAISLFYYLRVVKVMTINPELDSSPAAGGATSVPLLASTFVAVLFVPILTLLLYSNTLNEWTLAATRQLF